ILGLWQRLGHICTLIALEHAKFLGGRSHAAPSGMSSADSIVGKLAFCIASAGAASAGTIASGRGDRYANGYRRARYAGFGVRRGRLRHAFGEPADQLVRKPGQGTGAANPESPELCPRPSGV